MNASTLRPYQLQLLQAIDPTYTQRLGRGIRGATRLAPAALEAHRDLAMDDGTGNLAPLDLPQFQAARYHAESDGAH